MKGLTNKILALSMLLSVGAISCTSAQKGNVLKPEAYKAALTEKTDEILVDVRTPGEYESGHLKGALNIDWNNSNFNDQVTKLDKNKPVFVYCKSGGRSGAAAQALKEMGFKEVYDMDGGITSWNKQGLETTKDAPANQ